jgi:thiamine-monophosphate kinase
MSEFKLIEQYFKSSNPRIDLGIGDDAALLQIPSGYQLAVSTDMLVSGTHFYPDCPAFDIGWKSLAVNISDMAAMGAIPKWITLGISIPEQNTAWLEQFSRGLLACAKQYDVELIGGDTTKGPLNICVQIMGIVPIGKALQRQGAHLGDDIWVSGELGLAALGLGLLQGRYHSFTHTEQSIMLKRLQRPEPRLSLGLMIRELAHSCIDISDGLAADLGHLLKASGLGASIIWEKIPHLSLEKTIPNAELRQCVLAGGDDYELCFTASPANQAQILACGQRLGIKLSVIGKTQKEPGLKISYENQPPIPLEMIGYDHFR